ncbi:MAG: imidazole glycerol phosphate synthase subunit HisF [Nitrososphaerota archaeon]|nr:imidazole glycerol phosphate synthase subunit HisF [Candidatus Bathyarchaeota archaeon]MDW8048494.1 imidazole glycerol phosphate synthase subunit HisF [Nitrososphaerota archaeon]
MGLAKRIIPCLDVDHGRVVKGINFMNLRDAGDPVELGKRYSDDGADELVFLDVSASIEDRKILINVVRSVAAEIDIPFTVGGGIRSVDDARSILCNGADKVAVNTAAVQNPKLISELAETFGTQCVVVAIDAKRDYTLQEGKIIVETGDGACWYEVYIYDGRRATGIDALRWAMEVADLGAGEILVTSMDRDGTEDGYDLDLTRRIAESVEIPVIASGGAGNPRHFLEALTIGKADAALAASVFHYDKYPVRVVKRFLAENGVNVRL